MAVGKEIRTKISSVENTRKITKAMQMVAASKMRKVQERMRAARPYSEKIRHIAANLAAANPDYQHPFLARESSGRTKNAGFIVVTTDKGLCGGLNTNLLRLVMSKAGEVEAAGGQIRAVAIGGKGLSFLKRVGARVIAHSTHIGDLPRLEKLIGPVKAMLDQYEAGEIDAVHLCYTKFINTMKQEPVVEQLLPLTPEHLKVGDGLQWDYLYEPGPQPVIDELMERYIEALVYQAVAESLASEQAARMVAMKAATDNAGNIIGELKLLFNKTRQAAITREISEIVAGAAAV